MKNLCHWCNREINSDELIIALVPRVHDAAANFVEQGSYVEEQPWHQVCFGMIQGAPSDD